MSQWGWVRRAVAASLLVAAIWAVPAVTADAVPPPCVQKRDGGAWATYGADLHGTQGQDAEDTIDAANVATLEQAWKTGDTGYQSPPPIVSGSCVFINTGGNIVAYHLDTGRVVWTTEDVDTNDTFAVMVVDGRVHVGLYNGGSPQAAAFDLADGHHLWTSPPVNFGYPATQQASAIVYDGIQVLFTTGPDFDPDAREGYALIDAIDGHIIKAATTVPNAQEDGIAGGGVWGTPTVDPATGFLYAGTSNPEEKTTETEYDNSIIKLDLNRGSEKFGEIVGIYKGTPDSVTGYDNPVCQNLGETAWVNGMIYGSSPTCGQLDVDFGMGPTLFRVNGTLYGAAAQKSGVLHVFNAETMQGVWTKQVWPSMSFLGGNLARIATDGRTIYVAHNPGILSAFDGPTGTVKWQTPLTGVPMKGGNVALANGVLYYVDEPALKAFDATTGQQLWMSGPQPGASIGSGVSIAGHHVVANHYGTIAAYRLPTGS